MLVHDSAVCRKTDVIESLNEQTELDSYFRTPCHAENWNVASHCGNRIFITRPERRFESRMGHHRVTAQPISIKNNSVINISMRIPLFFRSIFSYDCVINLGTPSVKSRITLHHKYFSSFGCNVMKPFIFSRFETSADCATVFD
jgi:hypothetical protein